MMVRDGGKRLVYRSQLTFVAAGLLFVCFQLQSMLPKHLGAGRTVVRLDEAKTLLSTDMESNHDDYESAETSSAQDVPGSTTRSEEITSRTTSHNEGTQNDSLVDPQKDRSIIYMHVGKTGGTSLDTRFRSNCHWYNNRQIQTKCFENLQEDTKLSELVVNTFHMSMRAFNRRFFDKHPEERSFLISIRNPIARIVSSFNYEHPKNRGWGPPVQKRFYNNCYDTFPELMGGIASSNTTECSETAIQVLRGEGPHQISGHMYWNLYHHASYIPESSEVFVIRTENLWDDFNDLDRQLGGNAAVENLKADYGSSNFVVKSGVAFPDGSPEMIRLCCILQVETATYQQVLLRALNLNDQQKQQTLDVVNQQCGADGALDGIPVDWTRWAKRHQCKEEYANIKQIDK